MPPSRAHGSSCSWRKYSRFGLGDALLAQGPQAVIDQLAEFKRLGLSHLLLEFRRDDLARMLEILDLVATTIRPAVDRA